MRWRGRRSDSPRRASGQRGQRAARPGKTLRSRRTRGSRRPAPAPAGSSRWRLAFRPNPGGPCAGGPVSRCFRPGTKWCRRAARAGGGDCSTSPTVRLCRAMVTRAGGEVVDLGIVATIAPRSRTGLRKAAGAHDLILTTGGVSTGEEDHVKAAVESVGTLVLWRMASSRDVPPHGNHRRHAVHRIAGQSGREFCHLRPCGAADGAGAGRRHAAAAGAAAGARSLHLQEERSPVVNMSGSIAPGRERRARSGQVSARGRGAAVVACGHRRAGGTRRGIERVEPGQIVGFLAYASLV